MAKKIPMFLCPSYVDDDNVLQDCKCGKCAKSLRKAKK